MANNYFITGAPKSGKTAVLHELVKILKKRGVNVGGILSVSEREHGTKEKYEVVDISTDERVVLASIDGDGPKVSKYHVNIRNFEELVIPTMRFAPNYDVFIIDEIGPMEMRSTWFGDLLADILTHDVPVVAALNEEYVRDYKAWGRVIRLDGRNVETTVEFLLDRVGITKELKIGKKPKKKKITKIKQKAKPKIKKPKKIIKPSKKTKKLVKTKKVVKKPSKPVKKIKIQKKTKQIKKKRVTKPKTQIKSKKQTKKKSKVKKQRRKKGLFSWVKDTIGL